MRIKIRDIACYLPEQIVSNEDIGRENPDWDMRNLQERSGVVKRHVARQDETALDLAYEACRKLFSVNKDFQRQVDGIIFCTQSGDYIMPPNSCILHKKLELSENVFAFDTNLACSGFVYGLGLAQGLICSGLATSILLVTADTYSKYINKRDRSALALFGDGAAASLITASDSSEGIVDIQCFTAGEGYDKFIIPAGGCRLPKSPTTSLPSRDNSGNVRTLEEIHMDGMGILAFVNSKIPKHVRSILARNGLTVDEIDLFVFHQASKMALDSLARLLEIKREKMFQNLQEIGNTVSASIPIALKDALDNGRISRGDKVLLSGFGVGLSWGSAVVQL